MSVCLRVAVYRTSVTAARCVCMFVCLCVAIYRKFKLNERIYEGTRTFQICTRAKAQVDSNGPHYRTPHRWICWKRQRTPHRVTQRRWIYECERQIVSGEIDNAYTSTSAEQRNSLRLGRPGMMPNNRTHSIYYCSVPSFIPWAFFPPKGFLLWAFFM